MRRGRAAWKASIALIRITAQRSAWRKEYRAVLAVARFCEVRRRLEAGALRANESMQRLNATMTKLNEGMTMTTLAIDPDDDDLWHPSGWSPVYDGSPIPNRLMGFTTLQAPVSQYMLTKPGRPEDPEGTFLLAGNVRRILGRQFFVWVVESGDCRDMPDFWPI